MSKPTLLILAAGMGSRYGGLKQLDPVGPKGETIIEYSVFDAIRSNFGKVVCVIRSSFEQAFREKITSKFDARIDVKLVNQPMQPEIKGIDEIPDREKPWGTGHAVLCAQHVIDEPFVMINADDFYGLESFQIMSAFLSGQASPSHYAMVGFELQNTLSEHGTVSRGICAIGDQGVLKTVREHTGIGKTSDGNIRGVWQDSAVSLKADALVSMNMWGMHHSVFDYLEPRFNKFANDHKDDSRAEFYIPLVINELIQLNRIKLTVLTSTDKWYGVTYKQDRADVVSALKKMTETGNYPNGLWS